MKASGTRLQAFLWPRSPRTMETTADPPGRFHSALVGDKQRMCEIPADLRAKLEDRVREQVASEGRRDVSALYEFTLPSIRARRIAERDDEPRRSLASIREFVGLIHRAEVDSIRVERFQPSLARHGGCPAAVVVTKVRYNGGDGLSEFRCIWVYSDGSWFTTSLGKRRFFGPWNPPTE